MLLAPCQNGLTGLDIRQAYGGDIMATANELIRLSIHGKLLIVSKKSSWIALRGTNADGQADFRNLTICTEQIMQGYCSPSRAMIADSRTGTIC